MRRQFRVQVLQCRQYLRRDDTAETTIMIGRTSYIAGLSDDTILDGILWKILPTILGRFLWNCSLHTEVSFLKDNL